MPPKIFAKRENIMLAYPAEEKRIKSFPLFGDNRNFFHQPKLNGERGRTEWFEGYPYLISSYGNDFKFLTRIQEDLKALNAILQLKGVCFDFIRFDGEVYVHGWSREDIDSALRRTVNRSSKVNELQYHIFDWQDLEQRVPQWERIRMLGQMDSIIREHKLTSLQVVPYGICSEVDWLHHCSEYCEEGYEGIILRNPLGLYTLKRSPDLLKFKPTEKDEYKIKALNEAISIEGEPKGMVGSFEVFAEDEPGSDVTFNVGAGKLPHAARIRYWNMRYEIVARELMLEVKHELLRTTNKVPIAAVAVRVME